MLDSNAWTQARSDRMKLEHFSNKAARLGLVGIDVPVAGRAAKNLIHRYLGVPN
jgi:hypothetical protein